MRKDYIGFGLRRDYRHARTKASDRFMSKGKADERSFALKLFWFPASSSEVRGKYVIACYRQ
jgi:hypothetical protein